MTRQLTGGNGVPRANLPLLLLWAALGLLLALPLGATSVVLGSDAALADQAPVVLEATVEGMAPPLFTPWPRRAPTTDYLLHVERVLKGRVADETVRLRVLGGRGPNGLTLEVWGAPVLRAGERVLLFLVADADGSVRPLHLAVGVFHAVEPAAPAGRRLAVRDLSEMELVDAGGGVSAPGGVQVRDYERFAHWLADRAAGQVRPQDYQQQLPAGELRRLSEKFTLLHGQVHRWFEFDRGVPVHWTMSQAGQPGVDGGGFAEFQTAINAWNANQGTNIKYRFDGTSNFNGGLGRPDGHNTLATEDPQDDLPGSFTCEAPGVGSGILAAGGIVYYTGVPEPIPIIEADIVTQDGVGCWFNHDSARASQVFAHELGHTLGLGHSCGDAASGSCDTAAKNDALMRTTAHNDDRGPAIRDDDRAGIASLYGDGSGGGGSPPAAPSGLTATALSAGSIALAWQDNSTDATHIDVESKASGGGFQQVQVLAGTAASATVAGLAPGTSYSFRVRAQNDAGFSGYSNQASATTPSLAPPAAPLNLTATPGSGGGQIALAWQLPSPDVTAVKVDESSPLSDFVRVASLPAGATSYLVTGLAPGLPYTFRVRAQNSAGVSAPSNQASATAVAGGPPGACGAASPAGSSLCLLGGRFQVTVEWRNAGTGEHGSGQAIPLTGETGMFWFFQPTNVELIVKVLDGRPVNGFFWTFYGGLSDVEYWVTVTDTLTGHAQTYLNPPGNICGGADTRALAAADRAGSEPGPAPGQAKPPAKELPASSGCGGGAGQLCLLGGRFQVEVSWTNTANGTSGTGTAVPLNDQSGLFWFFDAANAELVAKIVDGRGLNGKFWFFYGALSDVQYDVKVTDVTTSAVRTYHNTAGNLCGRGDTSAF
jgi:chitodextrinase